MDWYLVHTRRGCEQAAAYHLEHSLQLEVYTAEVIQYRHGALQRVPLFPGYLFISAPRGGSATVERIDRQPGCGRLVRRHDDHRTAQAAPAVLPGDLVEQLRQRLAAVDAANDPPGRLPPQAGAQPEHPAENTQWRRSAFALEGALTGLLTAAARIELLLQVAGADEPEEDSTENDPPAPAVKRPRRTRGHGRRIHYR